MTDVPDRTRCRGATEGESGTRWVSRSGSTERAGDLKVVFADPVAELVHLGEEEREPVAHGTQIHDCPDGSEFFTCSSCGSRDLLRWILATPRRHRSDGRPPIDCRLAHPARPLQEVGLSYGSGDLESPLSYKNTAYV